MRAARKLIDVDKVAGDHGHLGLGGDHRGGAAVLGEQDLPLPPCRARFDHAAAAPGLPDPHPAQHHAAGRASSASSSCRWGPSRSSPVAADAVRPVDLRASSTEVLPKGGARRHQSLIYDNEKTTFRTEIDQALRTKPDMIYLNGYTPDIDRAAEGPLPGRLQGQDPGLRLRDQPEAARPDRPARGGRGHLHRRAVAGRGSAGLRAAGQGRVGVGRSRSLLLPGATTTSAWCCWPSPCQGQATGTAIKDNMRKISQGGGSQGRQRGRRAEGDRWPGQGDQLRGRQRARATSTTTATSSTASSATSRSRAASSRS